MKHRQNHYLSDESGVAATEFAMLAPVLLLLLMGIFDFGMYINMTMKLENTARAAAQYVYEGGDPDYIEDDIIMPSILNVTEETRDSLDVTTEFVCECSDSEVVDCTSGSCGENDYVRHFVIVTTGMDYSTIFPYPGLPSSLRIGGEVRLQIQ